MKKADYWIEKLGLQPHPEGGYFKETYRSAEQYSAGLPSRYEGARSFGTAIYFMLTSGSPSHFHRLKSDELWFFHEGSPLCVYMLLKDGTYKSITLGTDQQWQAIIPEGCWFAAEVIHEDSFSLISCTVSPGFDFRDFEMAKAEDLEAKYPSQKELIRRLCL
jgi:predicted cupin superfamily sugar epimerase